jgi:nucleotide-binding universal stress UspA family protein
MDQPIIYNTPFVNSIFHPSDFTLASENAFAHALALALRRKTRFTIFHAGGGKGAWMEFPAVRATLERWGMLKPGSEQSSVFQEFSVRVKKVNKPGRNPLTTTLDYLERNPTDLIVLATRGREGLPRWIMPSMAERIARKSKTMTLFVPDKARGFVSPTDGSACLKRIFIPVDPMPTAAPAVEYAARIGKALGEPLEVTLFHVGDQAFKPVAELPDIPGLTWHLKHKPGEVVETLLEEIRAREPDLIMMTTAGQEGFLDVLRGTVTEQILRRTLCPLLAIPMQWRRRD